MYGALCICIIIVIELVLAIFVCSIRDEKMDYEYYLIEEI